MSINVRVYENGDHTCLVWLPANSKPIPNCRGFTIRRVLNGAEDFLHGFVGFSDQDKLDPANPWKFPLQRFMWWDYDVKPGDRVQYSVIPVVGKDRNSLAPDAANASALTPQIEVSGQATPHLGVYFNKGIVAAQWVSRALAAQGKNARIADVIADPQNPLRVRLAGLLGRQILSLLRDIKEKGGEVYAALHELNDPELVAALTALGGRCHLILGNGAFEPPDQDANRKIRNDLNGKVDLFSRMVSLGHRAHNAFAVFCDSDGQPQRVLTGSTEWTMAGLCTQANNGLVIDDPRVAQHFRDEWEQIRNAGNSYPAALAQFNSTPKVFPVDGGEITQWFAPTAAGQELAFARELIGAAKDGILFMLPGPEQLAPAARPEQSSILQQILARVDDRASPDLYVRGIVNHPIAPLVGVDRAAGASPLTLLSGAGRVPQRLGQEAVVPGNIKTAFHNWQAENDGDGLAAHSKVIVLDPFGANPVVMTGSHDFSEEASRARDGSLTIVQGNAPLAAAYAVNIIAIYQSYHWNAYVEAHRQDPQVWHGLVDTDGWQNGYLDPASPERKEIRFWLGDHAPAGSAPTPG